MGERVPAVALFVGDRSFRERKAIPIARYHKEQKKERRRSIDGGQSHLSRSKGKSKLTQTDKKLVTSRERGLKEKTISHPSNL